MDSPIRVNKGIHDDSRGKHPTISLAALGKSRSYHIYLEQANYRPGDNTFVWRAQSDN